VGSCITEPSIWTRRGMRSTLEPCKYSSYIVLRTLRVNNDSNRISAQRVLNVRHLDPGVLVSKSEFTPAP
jgi:hypothetical protein